MVVRRKGKDNRERARRPEDADVAKKRRIKSKRKEMAMSRLVCRRRGLSEADGTGSTRHVRKA